MKDTLWNGILLDATISFARDAIWYCTTSRKESAFVQFAAIQNLPVRPKKTFLEGKCIKDLSFNQSGGDDRPTYVLVSSSIPRFLVMTKIVIDQKGLLNHGVADRRFRLGIFRTRPFERGRSKISTEEGEISGISL
jgi:hypothetical protein